MNVLLTIYAVTSVVILIWYLSMDIETAMRGVQPSIGVSIILSIFWPLVLVAFAVYAWRNAR